MSYLRLRNIQQLSRRLLSNITAEEKAIEEHARQTSIQWKYISLLVGVPVCGYLFVKHILLEDHEHQHKEYIPYEHIRIRKTQFPWGEESLFHSKSNYSPNNGEGEEAPKKEHFITALIRRSHERTKVNDDKIFIEFVTECHQKMMEHIERKKFVQYPPIMLPSYTKMFGNRKISLGVIAKHHIYATAL